MKERQRRPRSFLHLGRKLPALGGGVDRPDNANHHHGQNHSTATLVQHILPLTYRSFQPRPG